MAIHKIQINDFISTDYELIAIHSNLEDYRLAYFINQLLNIKLQKNSNAIEVSVLDSKSSFEHFIFDDEIQDICWHLVENKSVLTTKQQTASLFDNVDATIHLVPEFKKADYILKVDNTDSFFDSDIVLKQLSRIKFITMAYTINQDKLKSKNNLIF
ncbi:IPExxxVDY family protein [Flavobacterium sp. NRK F10]|uniref:IPExxxVDY family protein n=1 Tax=Flavobacterium sediminis TaxID=2201181 RepID=A0A2U8QUC2_9FLAO|nr:MULTISPECIES: IPExxxVDY family protein [Flavobacterium]AWM13476.1 IPExxxVDY family protein [Flavobacterium sediminis]MCO6174606.1 IPExxxVDY family protein [Flavobacterium sp. NRK F10]